MKILFCSDGSEQAQNAIRYGAMIAAGCQAEATILAIAEDAQEQTALLQAVGRGQQLLTDRARNVEITVKSGEPIEEIVKQTTAIKYDLVVIGAVRKGAGGAVWMPAKAYDIIKRITPPVLTVIGERAKLQHILICSGGKAYIDKAVQLTGEIARGTGAKVTLLHVMPEPPGMYADLIAQQEDVERLLGSSSPLGQNLKREKQMLLGIGVVTEVRVRHGEVMRELLREVREADYDLVVAGSSPARGHIHSYIMGNISREILNQAQCPVLVVRTGESSTLPEGVARFIAEIKDAFRQGKDE